MKRIGLILIILFSTTLLLNISSCSNSDANGNVDKKAAVNDTTAVDDSLAVAKKDSAKEEGKTSVDELIPVETTVIRKGPISSYILLSSNLETEKMADIYSRVQGIVKKINVEEGDYVYKGHVLFELEADEYELAEEKARIAYEKQKSAFNRIEAMFQKELLSNEEYEQAKFVLADARVTWKQADLNLNYTRIETPISGVVVDRMVRIGDRIQTTNKLTSVIDTEEMIAVVYVPEKEFETISKGQEAYITCSHIEDKEFPGWIKRVSPAVDPQSGTFKVTVGVKNLKGRLRPGMFVDVHVITDTHDDALLIPKLAIVYENDLMNVFVVRDSVAHKIELEVGFENHEKIESLNDIQEGEQIIIVGQSGLKDKTKVKVVSQRTT